METFTKLSFTPQHASMLMGGCLCYVWYKEYCCNVFFTTIFIAIPGATHVLWLESGLRGAAFTFLHTTFRFKAGRGVWFGHTQRCLDGDTKAESELRIMATFLFPFWHGLFQISEANLWRWRLAEVGRGGCCTECVCKPWVNLCVTEQAGRLAASQHPFWQEMRPS